MKKTEFNWSDIAKGAAPLSALDILAALFETEDGIIRTGARCRLDNSRFTTAIDIGANEIDTIDHDNAASLIGIVVEIDGYFEVRPLEILSFKIETLH